MTRAANRFISKKLLPFRLGLWENPAMNQNMPAAGADNPFHLEPEKPGFESMGHDNGFRFWWGSELAAVLGYDGLHSFRKAIERAMVTLTTLNVPIFENIIQEPRMVDGKS